VVDSRRDGELRDSRVVDRRVGAAAVEEAMIFSVTTEVVPDDLAEAVDAKCNGSAGGGGIVEHGIVERVSGHGCFQCSPAAPSIAPAGLAQAAPPAPERRLRWSVHVAATTALPSRREM